MEKLDVWTRKYMTILAVFGNGSKEPIEISDDQAREIARVVEKHLGPGYSCQPYVFNDSAVLFSRGKIFTSDELRSIQDDSRSITEIAKAYGTSCRVIRKIMQGKYRRHLPNSPEPAGLRKDRKAQN